MFGLLNIAGTRREAHRAIAFEAGGLGAALGPQKAALSPQKPQGPERQKAFEAAGLGPH